MVNPKPPARSAEINRRRGDARGKTHQCLLLSRNRYRKSYTPLEFARRIGLTGSDEIVFVDGGWEFLCRLGNAGSLAGRALSHGTR